MDDKRSLDGRTVVVTGASRGIGRGIVRTFSAVGANVVLFARGQSGLDLVAGELPPDRTAVVAGDVTQGDDLQRVIDTARERFGRLDVFCHCAGIYPLKRSRPYGVSSTTWPTSILSFAGYFIKSCRLENVTYAC